MAVMDLQPSSDAEAREPQALTPLFAFGRQANHFRCQLASGFQQRFDGAVHAFRDALPNNRS